MIKEGDVVFFRKCKKSGKAKSVEFSFKGHGFAVFLGHAPLFAPDPPPQLLLRMMGQIGFVSFDDIKRFVDEATFQKILDQFTDRYWGKKTEDIQKEAAERVEALKQAKENGEPPPQFPALIPPQSILVGPDGKPVTTEDTIQ